MRWKSKPAFSLMITSRKNPKIQWVRELQASPKSRRLEKAFVVEGVRLVEEALDSGWRLRLVLFSQGLNDRGRAAVARCQEAGVDVESTSEAVMRGASSTESPQGILAVVERPELRFPERLEYGLVLDQVRDPGNLGMILRTAAAAAVEGVYLTPDSADPYSPKVLRAGMGAHFRLVFREAPWNEIQSCLRANGLRVFLAVPGRGIPYFQADFRQPLALIIGGEAHGAGQEAFSVADQLINIPLAGGVESINTAAAAAILMFEAARQRGVTV